MYIEQKVWDLTMIYALLCLLDSSNQGDAMSSLTELRNHLVRLYIGGCGRENNTENKTDEQQESHKKQGGEPRCSPRVNSSCLL